MTPHQQEYETRYAIKLHALRQRERNGSTGTKFRSRIIKKIDKDALVAYVKANPNCTRTEVAKGMDANIEATGTALLALLKQGLIARDAVRRGGSRFFLYRGV